MKKKLILLIAITLMCLPFDTLAIEKYKSKNLEETLISEEMDANLGNYVEPEDKITIYMFRGQGCAHCVEFLDFLSSIVDEYGQYFNFKSYEVWNDADNNNLLTIVSSLIDGAEPEGVPYIVIGKKSFTGYVAGFDDDIKKAIIDLYNSEDAYDVMEHLDEYNSEIADETKDNIIKKEAEVPVTNKETNEQVVDSNEEKTAISDNTSKDSISNIMENPIYGFGILIVAVIEFIIIIAIVNKNKKSKEVISKEIKNAAKEIKEAIVDKNDNEK